MTVELTASAVTFTDRSDVPVRENYIKVLAKTMDSPESANVLDIPEMCSEVASTVNV